MSLKVIENTYIHYPVIPPPMPNDVVHWEREPNFHILIRDKDNKTILVIEIDEDGLENGKIPILIGTVAKYKDKGYKLVIGKQED